MKKNVDNQTIELYNAVKAAYFKYMPGLVRDNKYLKPLSVDMMTQLVNGRNVDNITIAEGTDLKQTIDLIPGFTCSLCSLPRIYKQVARLVGATCEKITITNTLPPYGITPEAATAKDNKKVYSLIKKVCKYDDLRIMSGVIYHDAARRCAVWTDAHKMICSPALYNPAAGGLCVDADGLTIGYRFPNYSIAVPDYKDCYELDTAAIIANCENALTTSNALAKTGRSNEELYLFNAGMIDGAPIGLDCRFLPFLKVVSGAIYAIHASRPLVGKLSDGGFILLMPRLVKQEKTPLNENTILYNEYTCIKGLAPVATASTHAAFVPAIVTEDTTKDTATEEQPEMTIETATETQPEAPTETITDAPTETETDRLPDNEQNNDTGHNTPLYKAETMIIKHCILHCQQSRSRRSPSPLQPLPPQSKRLQPPQSKMLHAQPLPPPIKKPTQTQTRPREQPRTRGQLQTLHQQPRMSTA